MLIFSCVFNYKMVIKNIQWTSSVIHCKKKNAELSQIQRFHFNIVFLSRKIYISRFARNIIFIIP